MVLNSITKYICKGLLLIVLLSQTIAQASHADDDDRTERNRLRGSFTLLASVAPLLGESWQYTHANLLPNEATRESGYGFTLDFGDGRGNAFALDYYNIYEEASRTATNANGAEKNEGYFQSLALNGPLLGYRYHYPMGLYMGLGFWYPDTQVKVDKDQSLAYKPEIISVLMLGFNSVLNSGFTVGAHLIHSLPATLEVDRNKNNFTQINAEGAIANNGELTGLQVTSVSLKLGYSW